MREYVAGFRVSGGQYKVFFCCIISLFFIVISLGSARAGYEKPPTLQAKNIFKPGTFKSSNYTVKDQVRNDGLFNHYTVSTKFGTFTADSSKDLQILVSEIDAIAAMKKVETDDTALAGLKQSGENTVTGLKNMFDDPQGTLEGAASGVSSLFNRAKETVGNKEMSNAEDSRLEQFVGISKSKGMIATKYGVNVYSQNKVLQQELDRLGRADFAGGLGVGIASSFVPGVGGLVLTTSGTARLLNEAINTTPSSELWLQNKNKLAAMGMNADTVKLFLNNPSFSPAQTTVMVAALESMKGVENLELFIKVALQAGTPEMAKIITRIVVMTAGYNKRISPLKKILPMARITQGVRKDGTRVVLLPTDYITWNKRIADAAAESKGLKTAPELWLLGTVSKQAGAELKTLGWAVHTDIETKLLPVQK